MPPNPSPPIDDSAEETPKKKKERRKATLTVETVKGESALIAVDEAQPKMSTVEWLRFNTGAAKKSAKARAKYREMGVGLVRSTASAVTDISRIKGVDAAYNYLLETAGRPPQNFMVYIGVAFIVGVGVGAFAIAI